MQKIVGRVRGRYGQYLLYVLALNYIEFLCATGNGNVWKPAANCTGIVLLLIFLSRCRIELLLNRINYIFTGICFFAAVIVFFHWNHHIGEYLLWQVETALFNVWWIAICVRYYFEEIVVFKRFEVHLGVPAVLWIIMSIYSLVGGSQRLWLFWYLLMFGAFYLLKYEREQWEEFVQAIVDGTIISFFIMQSYAYLFRPYDVVRYTGAFANTNMMALYYLIVYVMILIKLYMLRQRKASVGWIIFYFIGAAGLLGFQFVTLCRTAWVISAIITFLYGVMVLRLHWQDTWKCICVKAVTLCICAILVFPLVYVTIRYIPTIHPHPIWYEGEWSPLRVQSSDEWNSDKYISMDELLEAAFGRLMHLAKGNETKSPFVLQVNAQQEIIYVKTPELRGTTSSLQQRLAIWNVMLEHSEWCGHTEQEQTFMWEGIEQQIWHAQNLWVQFMYSYGFPVGVLTVILTIWILTKRFNEAWKYPSPSTVLAFLITVIFFLFGMLEIVWNPGQLILVLFFIVQHPGFCGEKVLQVRGKEEK